MRQAAQVSNNEIEYQPVQAQRKKPTVGHAVVVEKKIQPKQAQPLQLAQANNT